MKKRILFILALSLIFIFSGCSNKPEALHEPETPYEPERIVGYIYIQGDVLMVDEIEIVSREDTDRIKALGLESEGFPSGYHLYNPENNISSYKLTDDTTYIFTDCLQLYLDESIEKRLYETQKINEFIEGSSYQNTKLGDADKTYIPYFIEVYDGKVISIKEDIIYTI